MKVVNSLTKNRKSNEEIIMMIQKGLGNIEVIRVKTGLKFLKV